MIPARLALRNFLCYRDCPPLELEHVRVACLTGENGNGKSALLDAMTWALWGKARGSRDGELITLGQTEMEVDFEFYVGEARHRVIRKCQRAGSRGTTHTTVEFHMWDGAAWKVLSGSTQHETQRVVHEVVKLSYDTFVNSAFLMQGKADAFTLKSPGERKQVLAEILNLAQYDVYQERAKERRDERTRTADMLERQIHDAEYELTRLPHLRGQRDETAAELDQRDEELRDATAVRDALRQSRLQAEGLRRDRQEAERGRDDAARRLAEAEAQAALRRAEVERYSAVIADAGAIRDAYARLQEARTAFQQAAAEADSLRREVAQAERSHDEAAAELAQADARTAKLHAEMERHAQLAARAPAIRDGYQRLRAARAVLEEQGRRLSEQRRIEARIKPLEEAIARAEHLVRSALAVAQEKLAHLEPQAARLESLRRERSEAEQERAELDVLAGRLDTARAEESEQRAELQALKSANVRLKEEMEDLRRKVNELHAALEHGAAACPLCQSDLGREGLRRIEDSYTAEGMQKKDQYRANERRVRDLEASAQARGQEARRLDAELSRRQGEFKSRTDRLDRDIHAAAEASERLVEVRADVHRLLDSLDAGDFAREERGRLAVLHHEIVALAYDAEAHERAREQAAADSSFEAQYHELMSAESALTAARAALASEEQTAEGWRRRRDAAVARLADCRARLELLPVEAARREVEELAGYEARHQRLVEAESALPAARAALDSQEGAAGAWRAQRDTLDEKLADLAVRLAQLAGVEEQLPPAEARVRELETRCGELRRALGAAEQEIDRLEETERLTEARRLGRDEARREQAIYEELTRAFGRNGVQALIIDSALPEIEAVANDLLARMTNNRMHVSLETQRQALKGTTIETLDIKIADEWGTRNYEMFSGGEAFRINLSLRIALSKLLARRAGAPLPTLVIDEGFGTQDAAGRERLLEAINAIQHDFQCLLLVTHIDELKDMFDTRIEVVKNGDGSIARVVAA